MEDNKKISLCIPVYNRYELLLESFDKVKDDPRISEICIYDDGSKADIGIKIFELTTGKAKIKVKTGFKNQGVHIAKKEAVNMASNEFVILFDSDNVIDVDYIDEIYKHYWNIHTWYAPTFAKPHFNYKGFNNTSIYKVNLNQWLDKKFIGMSGFDTYGNTNNMFINKNEYLKCWEEGNNVNGNDSLWTAYTWLKNGNTILGVEGLEYLHRVDSHAKEQSGNYNSDNSAGYKIAETMNLLRQLK